MNKILILLLAIGASMSKSFSQQYLVLNKDTVGVVTSFDMVSYEIENPQGSKIISSNAKCGISLYRSLNKQEKDEIKGFIQGKFNNPSVKILYTKEYKKAGYYLIEAGKMRNKSILTAIVGSVSGSLIMAIGTATANPVLIYTGGAIISGSGISSLIMNVRANNLLIKSGNKMVSNSK
jgi:hypothetical protein